MSGTTQVRLSLSLSLSLSFSLSLSLSHTHTHKHTHTHAGTAHAIFSQLYGRHYDIPLQASQENQIRRRAARVSGYIIFSVFSRYILFIFRRRAARVPGYVVFSVFSRFILFIYHCKLNKKSNRKTGCTRFWVHYFWELGFRV
jgi:hypothetical protein